jgi:asparagine synthase (glutamine-hydrolysing)
MSGIAGLILPEGARPLVPETLAPMEAALSGSVCGTPLVLDAGRVGFVARSGPGCVTALREERAGGSAVALAFHGLLTSGPGDRSPEALLTALVTRGPSVVADLRGEFALAFWDGRSGTLHLATDRVRIQSLVWADRPRQFLFASRMAALLASPQPLELAVDPSAILDIVASSIVATPRTIFRHVEKLPPGHRLEARLTPFGSRAVRSQPYWDLDFTGTDGASPQRLARATRDALDAAIGDRLERDEAGDRFGAFLSGGIDSSTVTGILTRQHGGPIRTFSIGFGEERFNELRFARIASSAFGSRQTEYFVTPRDTAAAIERIVMAFDEPFGNASAVPTYFCAKLAHDHGVESLYAGDGGDELFAGNERYATSLVFERYDRIPRWLRGPIVTPAIVAAGTLAPFGLLVKAKKYVRRASLPASQRFVSYGFWNSTPLGAFASDALWQEARAYRPSEAAIRLHQQARAASELDRQLYVDMKITISDNDVLKVSRMCEQAGVAVRFPFLDERVVDAAARVPARLKMRGAALRTFFKETYRDLLPEEIRAKPKHGFGLPISIWLRTDPELNGMMRDLVVGPRALARGYFRPEALHALIRSHAEDRTSFYGTILWNLMVLELWHRRVLDARPS